MNDETRFVCWDCEKEFKAKDKRRGIFDEDVRTTVCNKCYSKRIKDYETNSK